MPHRASEGLAVGEFELKEFFPTFQVGHVRENWPIEGLDCRAGV